MTIYQVDPQRIDRNWNAITAELDAPVPSRIERLLSALGLPAHISRVALATPSLRRIWFVATALVVVIGLASADRTQSRDSIFTFLIIAPLLPVLGVAMAYGSDADPAHEIGLATPMRGLRLVLTRAVVVLLCSALTLSIVSIVSANAMALVWVLPGLALTLLTLAGSTVVSPRRSAVAVGGAWLVGLLILNGALADPVSAFVRPGQTLSILASVAAGVVLYQRRFHFDFVSDPT
jgi:hypothetical protein